MTWPLGLTVGQTFSSDGITYRVDAVYTDGTYAVTLLGGLAPTPSTGASAYTGGWEDILTVVASYGANTPPVHVAKQRHVVGNAPIGAWANQANQIAESDGVSWSFVEPWPGLHASLYGTDDVYHFNGVEWVIGNSVTTITNQVSLPNGNYGDFTVANGVATINPAAITATTTTTTSGSSVTEFVNPAGLAALTGPNQAALLADTIPMPWLPSEGRIWVNIVTSGQPFNGRALVMQLSFDGGSTWQQSVDNRPGIPGQDVTVDIGASQLPLEWTGSEDEYVWFSVSPEATNYGVQYRFHAQGYFNHVASGPIAIRFMTSGFMPSATTVKVIGVHFK